VVCATPTGSTAYAFSAGGPVVWPEVEALLMVPISAHALFARPLVVSPNSVLAVELVYEGVAAHADAGRLSAESAGHQPAWAETSEAVMWCDGRRRFDLPPGARVEVRRGSLPVLLARVHGPGPGADDWPGAGALFTDRLVAKFGLPVAGWRGRKETAGGHA
jgi:NAD+ kinase